MRIIYFLIIIISIFNFNSVYAQNIAVINIQSLIDESNRYINIIKEIEIDQEKYLKNFEVREDELKEILNEIEESKLILNETEVNTQINDYNEKLKDFTNIIEEFNFHYQNQIILIREIILKEIIALLEKYATKNNIELVLDSTSYLIASNTIDITDNIDKELEKINIKLEFKSFENN